MNATPPVRDRIAFVLLVPSLAVPIVAIALAAWRMQHIDDDFVPTHVGLAPIYFAAMITLTATFFSMTLNCVLAIRNHASLRSLAIPLWRMGPHFVVALIVVAWAVEFCTVRMEMEGWIFGLALVFGSVFSLVLVTQDRVAQPRLERVPLGARAVVASSAHPLATAIALGLAVYGLLGHSEVLIVAVAVLAFLGLPWSGFTGMFWLPVVVILWLASLTTTMPHVLALLAAAPALANALLSIILLRSEERRTRFVNDFLEARSFGKLARNTLGP